MSWQVWERWPVGVGDEFAAVPISLLRHAKALGLDDGDLRLLAAHEAFRFEGDGSTAVYPSQATLARLCGCSVDTVARRTKRLQRLGLIEVERRKLPDSRYRVNHYTRRGLDAALARLVEDYPAPVQGCGDDYPASVQGGEREDPANEPPLPRPQPADDPAPVQAEVEEEERTEEVEIETRPAPLRGSDSFRRSRGSRKPTCIDCQEATNLGPVGRCPTCHEEWVSALEEAS